MGCNQVCSSPSLIPLLLFTLISLDSDFSPHTQIQGGRGVPYVSVSLRFSTLLSAYGQVLLREGLRCRVLEVSRTTPETRCSGDAVSLWISERNQATRLNSDCISPAKSPPWESMGSELQAGSVRGKLWLIRREVRWALTWESLWSQAQNHGPRWRKGDAEEADSDSVSAGGGGGATQSVTSRYFGREIQTHHVGEHCFLNRRPLWVYYFSYGIIDFIIVLTTQFL